MKAKITADGRLALIAESSTEGFALSHWMRTNVLLAQQPQTVRPVPVGDASKEASPPPAPPRSFPAIPAELVTVVTDRA